MFFTQLALRWVSKKEVFLQYIPDVCRMFASVKQLWLESSTRLQNTCTPIFIYLYLWSLMNGFGTEEWQGTSTFSRKSWLGSKEVYCMVHFRRIMRKRLQRKYAKESVQLPSRMCGSSIECLMSSTFLAVFFIFLVVTTREGTTGICRNGTLS